MSDLATWVETHIETLVTAATAKMAPSVQIEEVSDAIRSQIVEVEGSVHDFFEAFARSVRMQDLMPLNIILIDWIEARTIHEGGETLLPALSTLKMVLWDHVIRQTEPAAAIDLLRASDKVFTQAMHKLASLEADAQEEYMRASLEDATANLARLDQRKSDFIEVAAHELKTPLTLIEGYQNMLEAMFPMEQYPNAAQLLAGIARGADRLDEIIQDMIDVSKIDMDLLDLHLQPVWIKRLIETLQYDLREKLDERSVVLVVEWNKITDEPTYADPMRLGQVLNKIVSNAIKYTPDGGTITISGSGDELPGFLDLTVTDTGIGIAPENLIHIFEKFSSLTEVATHSSGKVKFKGAGPGLGLAIAKGIMEAHAGTIWAESDGYDEVKCPGSTFHIMIPLRSAGPAGQAPSLLETPQQ
jgi:signal transduction histidine kinase